MKDIIEHLLNVEKTAKRIIAEAEGESSKILEAAMLAAREAAQEKKEAASEESRALCEKMLTDAQAQKKKAIESAEAEGTSTHTIDKEKRENAIQLVMKALAGLS